MSTEPNTLVYREWYSSNETSAPAERTSMRTPNSSALKDSGRMAEIERAAAEALFRVVRRHGNVLDFQKKASVCMAGFEQLEGGPARALSPAFGGNGEIVEKGEITRMSEDRQAEKAPVVLFYGENVHAALGLFFQNHRKGFAFGGGECRQIKRLYVFQPRGVARVDELHKNGLL